MMHNNYYNVGNVSTRWNEQELISREDSEG